MRDDLSTAFLAQLSRIPKPERWIIAHSGGLDSQVLLHLACLALPKDQILVIHINHGLQAEATAWADFSQQEALALGVSHQVISISPVDGSEQAARQARYQGFESVLSEGDCLLLGHHADDQAETMLFRLVRGAGLKGAAGMPVQRKLAKGNLFRPLLPFMRAELERWASRVQLDWVEDPSNTCSDYDRNYLRNQVMPLLEQRWQGFSKRWSATANLLADTDELLNGYLNQDLQHIVGELGQLKLTAMPTLQDRRYWPLVRRWCSSAGVELTQKQQGQVESQLLRAREDAQPMLRIGDHAIRRYRQALFVLQYPAREEILTETFLSEGECQLGDGVLSITAKTTGLKTLDGLQLRRRQGGERLRPANRNGSCSLKKLLQEAGIPPWWRERWPLLYKDDEIVAVPGVCVCLGWWSENGGFQLNWQPF